MEDYSVYDGPKDSFQVRAISQVPNSDSQVNQSWRKCSPLRNQNFSPSSSPMSSGNLAITPPKPNKVGMGDVVDQLKAMRSDYARMDGKLTGINGRINTIDGKVASLDGKYLPLEKPVQNSTWELYKSHPP